MENKGKNMKETKQVTKENNKQNVQKKPTPAEADLKKVIKPEKLDI